MLKISAMSSMVSQDLGLAVRFADECGMDGLDLDRVWEQPIEIIAASGEIESIKRVSSKEEVRIYCLATNIFRCQIDSEATFQEHLGYLEGSFRLAESLHYQGIAPIIRCYAFIRSGKAENHLLELVERFRMVAELAARNGFTVGIQNDAQTFLGTGRELAQFLKTIDNDRLKAVWDPCASLFDVDLPEIPYPDGYRCLQTEIVHVVLRDVDRRKFYGSFREVEFGEGLVDHRRQVTSLMDDGYQGAVSLATIWRPGMDWDRSPDMADFSEAGAHQAVRICLRNLRAMMASNKTEKDT
jgi:sugar phosphate isomerase/epimerase